ncbi:MAG: LysM peptidoglycan-binding domain-containing M23 family metallopeptidase [Leptospiraceae bacterium]|nr:LysM peptidoglycan-binding domain-containing M23 family metallopeptidase [Leptospiraceae bacterium]MDW8307261.1 LysM peptidoglycan-binding domain-containing M23 family metallopeptidase [Leptospiraceae bacterium]
MRWLLWWASFFPLPQFALGWQYYQTKPGDNLEKIAQRFRVSVRDIQLWNSITNPDDIRSGQQLRILQEKPYRYLSPYNDEPDFQVPLKGGRLERRFSSSLENAYYGLLWSTFPGSPVYASESGVVLRVSPVRGYGTCIFLDHGGGWLTVYAHLANIQVKTGERVKKRQLIATTQNRSFFFSVSYGGRPIDPSKWLRQL